MGKYTLNRRQRIFGTIKAKVAVVIIGCLLAGTICLLFLLRTSYNSDIDLLAHQSVRLAENTFKSLELNDTKMLSSTLEALLTNSELKRAYIKKDRQGLYKIAAPIFDNLKWKYGITHWYFINPEPDKRCFLRVHKPEENGDEISRATYLKSVETKGMAAGKELGKTAFALRVVHPYYNGQKLIGYMELGEEIGHFFDEMKRQTGSEYGILIDKKYLSESDWASVREANGLRNNWGDMDRVVLVDKTTEDERLIEYKGDIEQAPDGGDVLEEIKKGGHVFARGFFPIYDAAGRKAGAVFVLRDITDISNGMRMTEIRAMIFIFTLMLIITAVLLIMLRSMIFVRLDNMTRGFIRVVAGDYKTKLVQSSDDEIGRFEALFEQFRVLYADAMHDLDKLEKKEKNS